MLDKINKRLDLYHDYQRYKSLNWVWFLPKDMMLEITKKGFWWYEDSCVLTFDLWLVKNGYAELVI